MIRAFITVFAACAFLFAGLAAASTAIQPAAAAQENAAGEVPCHGSGTDAPAAPAPDCCADCACADQCTAPSALPSPATELDEFIHWHFDSLQASAALAPPHRYARIRPPIAVLS